MSTFDELKIAVRSLRRTRSNFTRSVPPSILVRKIGKHQILTLQEAVSLFDEQLQTIESALEDKEHCIRHVSEIDMRLARDLLLSAKQYINAMDSEHFTTCIEDMNAPVRSFAMSNELKSAGGLRASFLEKEKEMDSRWHREMEKLENIHNDVNSRLEHFSKLIEDQMERKWRHEAEKLENIHDNLNARLENFSKLIEERMERKSHDEAEKLEKLLNLIQERSENIAAQEAKTKDYEEKLERYKNEHEETIDKHNTEREELLQKVHDLISKAEKALEINSAVGLSKYFLDKEKEWAATG